MREVLDVSLIAVLAIAGFSCIMLAIELMAF